MDLQIRSDRCIHSRIDSFTFVVYGQSVQRFADSRFTGIEFFADAMPFDRNRQSTSQLNAFSGFFLGIGRRDQDLVLFADFDARFFQNSAGVFKNSGHYFFLSVITQNYFLAVSQTDSTEN